MVLTINGKEITCPDCLEWYEENGELPAQCTCGHRQPSTLSEVLAASPELASQVITEPIAEPGDERPDVHFEFCVDGVDYDGYVPASDVGEVEQIAREYGEKAAARYVVEGSMHTKLPHEVGQPETIKLPDDTEIPVIPLSVTGGGFALVAPVEPEAEPMESHPELLRPVPAEFFEELYSGECQCSQQLAQDASMWQMRFECEAKRNRDYLMTNADLLRANKRLNESIQAWKLEDSIGNEQIRLLEETAEETAIEARRVLVENERLRAELERQRAFNESLDDQIGLLDQRRAKLVKMAWRMRRQRNSAIEAGRQHKSDLRESQKESAARNAWIEELQERLTSAQQRIAELEAQLAAQPVQAEPDPKG